MIRRSLSTRQPRRRQRSRLPARHAPPCRGSPARPPRRCGRRGTRSCRAEGAGRGARGGRLATGSAVLRRASDDALVAAVDGNLRRRGLGEERAAHLGSELSHVLRGHLGAEEVVFLVLLDGEVVGLGARGEHLFGPQGGVVHGVRMERVDADAVLRPLERRHARELVERSLRGRIGAAPGPGAGTFFEPITTIRPPRGASLSKPWQACITSRLASTLTVIALRHMSLPMSCTDCEAGKMPALRTSMSTPPNCLTARSTTAAISFSFVKSQTRPKKSGRCHKSSIAGLRSRPTTAAPRLRNDSAQALPMPEAAPVTTTTSPVNAGGLSVFFSLACSRSQYSMSKVCRSSRAFQPPSASARRITSMV